MRDALKIKEQAVQTNHGNASEVPKQNCNGELDSSHFRETSESYFASVVSQEGLCITYTIENATALYTSSHETMTDDMWQFEHTAWIGWCDKPTGTMVAIG